MRTCASSNEDGRIAFRHEFHSDRRLATLLLDRSAVQRTCWAVLAVVLLSAPAWAESPSQNGGLLFHHRPHPDVWHVDFTGSSGGAAPNAISVDLTLSPADPIPAAQPVHAAAIQHSDAYLMRARVHRYASYASLPLFAAEVYLGESLYNSADPRKNRGAHIAVGTAIIGLFGVNTVTGAWNLFGPEGRGDKQDRTIKLVHGLLMMAADVGFVATVATAPHRHRTTIPSQSAMALHRDVALTSIALGTTGYLIMFVHNF